MFVLWHTGFTGCQLICLITLDKEEDKGLHSGWCNWVKFCFLLREIFHVQYEIIECADTWNIWVIWLFKHTTPFACFALFRTLHHSATPLYACALPWKHMARTESYAIHYKKWNRPIGSTTDVYITLFRLGTNRMCKFKCSPIRVYPSRLRLPSSPTNSNSNETSKFFLRRTASPCAQNQKSGTALAELTYQ